MPRFPRLPGFPVLEEPMTILRGSADFVGINYYRRNLVAFDPGSGGMLCAGCRRGMAVSRTSQGMRGHDVPDAGGQGGCGGGAVGVTGLGDIPPPEERDPLLSGGSWWGGIPPC